MEENDFEEMYDSMIKKEKNISAYHQHHISFLFGLGTDKTQALIDDINKFGAGLSFIRIAKTLDLSDTAGSASAFRDALVSLAHGYLHHIVDVEEDFKNSEFGDEGFKKIKGFFEKLKPEGVKGLDIRFEANRMNRENVLTSLGSETVLREVLGEDREVIGFLPLMRTYIQVLGDDKSERRVIEFELEECRAFIKGLQDMVDDFLISAKKYKEKLGHTVVVDEC
jgi:hypothetical protein